MRITAELVQTKDLKPGDLYSEHDQAWWDNRDNVSIGHYVIVRNSNVYPEGYKGVVSYKITIDQDDEGTEKCTCNGDSDLECPYHGTVASIKEIEQFQVDDAAEQALGDQEDEEIAEADLASKYGGSDGQEDTEEANDETVTTR